MTQLRRAAEKRITVASVCLRATRARPLVDVLGLSLRQSGNNPNAPQGQESVMGKKLFVGNLAFATSGADLEALFASAGTVESATVVNDRDTGRSRGFGFVEMSSASEASKAIAELNGKEVGGRPMNVSEAKEQARTGGGGGGGRRNGGGYGSSSRY
jgi:RNA recognition motif-containing protein